MYKISIARSFIRNGLKIALIVIVPALAGFSVSNAQQPATLTEERERGIKLIEAGNLTEAIKVLRAVTKKDKSDIAAWHWVGVAFERSGKTGDARKAYEKAANLGDALLLRQFDLRLSNDFAEIIKTQIPEIAIAALSVESYLRLSPKLSKKKMFEWNERSEFLSDYRDLSWLNRLSIYKSTELTTRPRILEKPEPQYTEQARAHSVTGTVVLRAILAEDGKVRGIMVRRGLPYGLSSSAIHAARQIRFVPGVKDGRPASMWIQIEYNFNLY
jgi:TonB family protein